jgi:hypothetical protein
MAKKRWWPGLGVLTAVLVLVGGTASAATGWTVVSVPSTGNNVGGNSANQALVLTHG